MSERINKATFTTLANRPPAAHFGIGKCTILDTGVTYESDGIEWVSNKNNTLTWATKPTASSFGIGQAWFSDTGVMGYSDGVNWDIPSSPWVVNNVADLATAPVELSTIIVKSDTVGGLFNWSANGVVDNAITYPGVTGYWVRSQLDNINLKYFLTDTTGATDQAANFIVARELAKTLKKPLFCPTGITIGIGSTIDMTGVEFIGSGGQRQSSTARKTVIKSLITNGTPVFKMEGASFYSLQNFQILGSTSSSDPAANAANCIGIQVGDPDYTGSVTAKACTNGILDAIDIFGCATGIRSLGWSNAWGSVTVRQAIMGVYLDRFNASSIQSLRITNCNQYFKIRNTSGCNINLLACEGLFETTSSTIDGAILDAAGGSDTCTGVLIGNLRYENSTAAGTVPFLDVGFSGLVSGFYVNSGFVTGIASQIDIVRLDNVDGYRFDVSMMNASKRGGLYITARSKRKENMPTQSTGYVQVSTKLIDLPARNLFPNGKMNGRGFLASAIDTTNATLSDETTLYRSGYMATKVLGTDGAQSGRIRWDITDANFINSIKIDSITVAAWVFIPDKVEFDLTQPTKLRPQITVNTLLGAASVSQTLNGSVVSTAATTVGWFRKGGWNFAFLEIDLTNQAFDTLRIGAWINNDATVMTNGAYIIVDEVFVCPGKVASKIYSGAIENSNALCTYHGLAKTLMVPSANIAALKAVANNSWIVGDRLERTDPAAGGFLGEVCTTAGIAGAATWKTYGAITA